MSIKKMDKEKNLEVARKQLREIMLKNELDDIKKYIKKNNPSLYQAWVIQWNDKL